MRTAILYGIPLLGLVVMLALKIDAAPQHWPWDLSLVGYSLYLGWMFAALRHEDNRAKQRQPLTHQPCRAIDGEDYEDE